MVPHNDTHEKSTTTVDTAPSLTNNAVSVSAAAASDSVVRSEGEIGTVTSTNIPSEKTKKIRSIVILWQTMKEVGAQRIFIVYLAFLLICCGLFCILEPETFPHFGNAVWYCFQTITTIGFGDIVPTRTVVRVLSVIVGLSALFVVALLTGITVSFFNEKMRFRRNESFIEFDHYMNHLTELDKDQLARLEEQYRTFRKNR